MTVYLIGFMGVGKTSIGKRLAKALDLHYCDLDSVITTYQTASISQIFDTVGETEFREIEARMLRSLSATGSPYWTEKGAVVSTGGGSPCFHENMDFMMERGIVIWLKMRPEIIASRLKSAKNKRPLIAKLNDDEILDFVVETLNHREVFYKKAPIHFEASDFDSQRLTELAEAVKSYSK